MSTPIPLRSDALTHALELSRRLGRQAELGASSRLSRELWAVTIEAALARRHLAVAVALLQPELRFSVSEAVAELGQVVERVGAPSAARTQPWLVDAVPRLDRAGRSIIRACEALTMAERHRQLAQEGPPPASRERGGVVRVLGRVFGGLDAVLQGRDGWQSVTLRLERSLCRLIEVEPVRSLAEPSEARAEAWLGLEPAELKRALHAAHEAVAEAMLLALGQLAIEDGEDGRPIASRLAS